MKIKMASYLIVMSLSIHSFLLFSLQSTPWLENPNSSEITTARAQEQKQPVTIQTNATGKTTIIIDSPDLELFVLELLKKASAEGRQYYLSEDLLQVCEKILSVNREFSPEEIAQALPELLAFASAKIKETKAQRLDAPGSEDGSTVGPSVVCAADQVIQLLNQLINIVIQCCNTLQADFAGTFTLFNDFNGTFTLLDELINTVTIDFDGTFTTLIDIKNTVTIDFNGTFTALEACCETIFVDFNGVFTTLTDIENTVIVDFNATFTTLVDLKNTMTIDFNGTFTTLQACCQTIFNDFNGTFSALDDSAESILAQLAASTALILENIFSLTQIQADFNGTFTTINNLSNQLTNIELSLITINMELEQINSDLVSINNDLTTINSDLTTINNNLVTITNALNQIAENVINCLAPCFAGCSACT
jgi:hypothetical protein